MLFFDSYKMDIVVFLLFDKFLYDELLIVIFIVMGFKGFFGVVCLNDEEIWICDMDKIMRFFNF